MNDFNGQSVRALLFDVFGTVVDWRTSIIAEGEQLSTRTGQAVDWAAFADAWRAGYQPAMQRVRSGEQPWTRLDDLHRMILDELLLQFGLADLTAEEIGSLNRVWHRLQPWPDAIVGLERLRRRYIVATLSNGNVALLVNMAKHAGLPWDCVFSAELFGHYKPDREVYLGAVQLLGLMPAQVMMVAAHPSDLDTAQQAGLRTAYVPRPLEFGPRGATNQVGPNHDDPARYDVVAEDFTALAVCLDA